MFFSFASRLRAAGPLASIFVLVPADGRLSDLDWVFLGAGELLARTVVLTLVLALTTGDLVLRLVLASLFACGPLLPLAVAALEVVVSSLGAPLLRVVVGLETAERALVAALLIPVLMDRGVSALRLVLAVSLLVFFGLGSSGFEFFECSLGRGPRTPRQLAEPHRHSWTFRWEYGLWQSAGIPVESESMPT